MSKYSWTKKTCYILTTHWKLFWIQQFQKIFPQNLPTLADSFHKNPLYAGFLVIKWREKATATLMVLMIGCFGQMTLKGVEHPWCIFMTLELTFSFMGVLAFESKSKALKVAWGLWSKLGLENNTSGEKTTWLCMISSEFTHAHMPCTTCQAHDNKFLQAIYVPQLID